MATLKVYVITEEETHTEQIDYETKETETITDMNVVTVYVTPEQTRKCLIECGYEYNPKDNSFILPTFGHYTDERFMRVFVFDAYEGECVKELSPKDLFGEE